MWPRVGGLRAFGLGTPGPMRERLTALALAGEKVATAGLWQQDYVDEGEALDDVGEHQALLGSDGTAVATVEIVRVEVHPFASVPWEFARDEGEGFTSIEDWRQRHSEHWRDQGVEVDGDSLVVCAWFRVVAS
jgi:uncharacterized protein YhfF